MNYYEDIYKSWNTGNSFTIRIFLILGTDIRSNSVEFYSHCIPGEPNTRRRHAVAILKIKKNAL